MAQRGGRGTPTDMGTPHSPPSREIDREKKCVHCEIVKPADDFRLNPRMRTGLHSWCKACTRESGRRWVSEHRVAYNAARRKCPPGQCASCGGRFEDTSSGRNSQTKCPSCKQKRSRERWVAKAHKRRVAKGPVRDLGAAEVRRILASRTFCPLCRCRMNDEGRTGNPRKKHLDHIVPLNVGGTHTLANVRVICASCNLARPKDGGDVTQETLWARAS